MKWLGCACVNYNPSGATTEVLTARDSCLTSKLIPLELLCGDLELPTETSALDIRLLRMAEFELSGSFIPSLHKPAALLPITRHRDNLLYLIETFPVTIVVAATGSGKTFVVPHQSFKPELINIGLRFHSI